VLLKVHLPTVASIASTCFTIAFFIILIDCASRHFHVCILIFFLSLTQPDTWPFIMLHMCSVIIVFVLFRLLSIYSALFWRLLFFSVPLMQYTHTINKLLSAPSARLSTCSRIIGNLLWISLDDNRGCENLIFCKYVKFYNKNFIRR
jgi:hypothetical protein